MSGKSLGHRVPALCTIEIGGLNGFSGYIVGPGRIVLDADCMGRALPGIDQITLLAGQVPDLVVATTTGDGVGLVDHPRPEDAEAIVRAALRLSGGTGAIVIGGFTVGDLAENACLGSVSRALHLGREFLAAREAPIEELARALGGRLLAQGRIQSVLTDAADPQIQTYQLAESGSAVHRLVTGSETLAFMTDGQVISAAPSDRVRAISRRSAGSRCSSPGRWTDCMNWSASTACTRNPSIRVTLANH